MSVMTRLLDFVDKINEIVYKMASWLVVPLFLGLFYEVVARYGFHAPTIWAYDMSYMLYGAMFILGAPYVLARDKHVRVDLFYEKFSARNKKIVDLVLYLIFFFPAVTALTIKSIDYAIFAWQVGERSSSGSWRPSLVPLRLIFAAALILLLIQVVACFFRNLSDVIKGGN